VAAVAAHAYAGGDGTRADTDGDGMVRMQVGAVGVGGHRCGGARADGVVVRVPGRGGQRRRRNWRLRRGVEPRHGPVECHWKLVLRRSKWGGERVIRITLTKGGRGKRTNVLCGVGAELLCRLVQPRDVCRDGRLSLEA
jgi:hypothetical protein